jgi:hypothetical protein
MADMLDLFNEDYDRIIEHCKESSGTLAIKEFINSKIRKYISENDYMITVMMERLERNYPDQAIYDLDDDLPFWAREISNFQLDCKEEPDAALKFLYSYLNLLSYDNELQKILKPSTAVSIKRQSNEKLSFKIDKRHKESLLQLTRKLNVNIDLLMDREGQDMTAKFVEILLADDIRALDPQNYTIQFNCQTRIVVYVFGNLMENYNPETFIATVGESGLFRSKQSNPITSSSISKTRTELNSTDPLAEKDRRMIDKIFNECNPSKFIK